MMRDDASFYQTARWRAKAEHIKRMDGYRDAYVWRRYRRSVPAKVVHHIYPRRDYPQWAWADWNLISVSIETHKLLENNGTLTAAGVALMEQTTAGVDWRRSRAEFGTR